MNAQPGNIVGRWQLLERLGGGGMGEVWRAQDTRAADCVAALKLMRQEASDPSVVLRFVREAESLCAIAHPNVVRGLDYGRADDGTPFLSMELLTGETLAARVERLGALPPPDVARIGRDAAAGIGAAHAQGMVHRDIKPANLFLCGDGAVKVLDFGLGVPMSDGDMAATRLTQTGALIGTPSYMAPEQARGERGEDARTDVWALGATLYHALCGKPPFHAGGNVFAEMYRIVTEQPEPLPDGTPRALREVLTLALAKDPGQRFDSMHAFGRALTAVSAQSEAAARSAGGGGMTLMPNPLPTNFREESRLIVALVAEGLPNARALEVFLAEVGSRGGAATGLVGGRAVGVFGGSEWLGDEFDRAVRAMLGARGLAARMGVGTGKAVVRRGDTGFVAGAAIRAAEAAMRAGEPMGLCPETLRRVRNHFVLQGSRVLDQQTPEDTGPVRVVGGVDVPMVGRGVELRRLADIVERAIAESRAHAVIVHGPPGIGKSRLRHELRSWLERERIDVLYLEGRAEPTRRLTSFAVISDALRRRAAVPEGTSADQARARIEAMVPGSSLEPTKRRGTADFVGELLGVPFPENEALVAARRDPQAMADRIRLAVGSLFEDWSAKSPLILAIEDAQWIDGASLSMLDFLMLRLSERPFVILATARPEFLTERVDALPGAERIEVRELAQREVEQMVTRILGHAEPAVVQRSAGTPFFVEELALAVRDGADPASLPLTIEGAVQSRLDRLSSDEKDVLKRAAVLGRRFWAEAVATLGQPDAPRLFAALRRRDFVAPRPDTRLAGCSEWVFRHVVVQEVALGMLTDEQRRNLHALAATWLAARADAPLEEIAQHYEHAGELAGAARYWKLAAEEAHRRGDSERVLAFANQALATERVTASDQYLLRLLRSEALSWIGRIDEEEAELKLLDALENAGGTSESLARRKTIDLSSQARVAVRRAVLLMRRGRMPEAVEAARNAVRIAQAGRDLAREAEARARLGQAVALSGQREEGDRELGLAWDRAAASGDAAVRARAAASRAFVLVSRGEHAKALAWRGTARSEFTAAGRVREATTECLNTGSALLALGDYPAAQAMLDEALHLSRELGLRRTEGFASLNLGLLFCRIGDVRKGLEATTVALAAARAIGEPRLAVAGLVYRAMVHLSASDTQAALSDVNDALGGEFESTNVAFARAARACVYAALGRHHDVLTEAQAAWAGRDVAGGMEELEIDLQLAQYDALLALGRKQEAAAILSAARARYEERLAHIEEPRLRQAFSENVPAHRRLAELLNA